MFERRHRLFLFPLAAAALPYPVHAQERSQAVDSYPTSFFAGNQPVSAFDMIERLPGFRLQESDGDRRGYSGAAGNILIDGKRPAIKDSTLEEQLKRIQARAVDRVELIRSSAAGYDMQGYALLANIVRKSGGRVTGRIEAQASSPRGGDMAPRVAADISLQSGDRRIDLQAAIYREIDDEDGFGSRHRFAPDGSPLRLTDFAQPEYGIYKEISAIYSRPFASGTLRASGQFNHAREFSDVRQDIYFPEIRSTSGAERETTRSTEGELRYDRPIGEKSRLELIAVRRDTRQSALETTRAGDNVDVDNSRSTATETVARAVLRRTGEPVAIEIGAEGALNSLRSRVALSTNGEEVPLPAANVRVDERRAEAFGTATVTPAKSLTVAAGLRYEMSRLRQRGDSVLVRPLAYLKPRVLITHALSARDQVRFRVEREVGQLDFGYFVSEPSVINSTLTAGNRDLRPDTLWRAELAWERSIGTGSLVLTARREWVGDVIDRVAVLSSDGVFDSVGNIGDGTRDEAQIDANLPLDGVGLPSLVFKTTAILRHSRVRDPQTGLGRRISGDLPREIEVSLIHAIRAFNLRWSVRYVAPTIETQFKINEIQHERVGERVDAFVEYKPDALWTIRLFGKNLTDSPASRTRWISIGLRGGGALDYREEQRLRSGRYLGINFQRTW